MHRAEDSSKRVLLWSHGRAMSTVFLKCLSYVKGVQILSEPYVAALTVGPEKDTQDVKEAFDNYKVDQHAVYEAKLTMAFESDICTFDWVKQALEAKYPGKDIVFCKDMAFAVDGKYDKLPTGFRHTFLMRHPHKVFLSWKKMIADLFQVPVESFPLGSEESMGLSPKRAYGELYDLMMYLKNRGDEPKPIIIDADDLQSNPDSILRQYFATIGLPYDESLLNWPAGTDALDFWIGSKEDLLVGLKPGGFYENCVKSTCFLPPSPIPKREDLSEDIQVEVDYVWKWYMEMYDMRLRP